MQFGHFIITEYTVTMNHFSDNIAFCPEDPTSWCKYKNDISNDEKITIKKLSDQCIS